MCTRLYVFVLFCFVKFKKHPIQFRINDSNPFLARTFCWLALCDFQLHGRQWLLAPQKHKHTPTTVCAQCAHNWCSKCVKIKINVFNFFYRSRISLCVSHTCCVCRTALWHILKLTVAHSLELNRSVTLQQNCQFNSFKFES